MRSSGLVLFLVHLLFGLYFINYPFNFITIPEWIVSFEPWIIFIGGLLTLFGAVNYYRAKRVLNPVF